MLKRTIIILTILCAAVFATSSLPSAMVIKKTDNTDCTQPDYEQVTIDGSCWLLEYCDGVLVNKTPISDGPCQ